MADVFVSYARKDVDVTALIVEDINSLGYKTWYDRELSGGQAWWTQILSNIRDCDIFIFILSPHSLGSEACKREYGYAFKLGKTILPVLVSAEVSTNLLPQALSQIQFISYLERSREEAFLLAKAFTQAKSPAPLPDPLPAEPELPISYLSSLGEKIASPDALNYENQSSLLLDLKRQLREKASEKDAKSLLKLFQKRKDLYAAIGEEINELLVTPSQEQQVSRNPELSKEAALIKIEKTPREADLALCVLVLVNLIIGVITTCDLADFLTIDLFYIQIFSAVYIGYAYSKKVAMLSGALIFLPNLVLHILGSSGLLATPEEVSNWNFTGDLYKGEMRDMGFYWFHSRTLGLAYFFFAPLAFVVSLATEFITRQSENEPSSFDSKYKRSYASAILAIVLLFLLSNSMYLGAWKITGVLAMQAVLYIQVFKYGIHQVRGLLLLLLFAQVVVYRMASMQILVSLQYQDFALFLVALTIGDRITCTLRKKVSILPYLAPLLFMLIFFCTHIAVNQNISLHLITLTLPLFFIFGYRGGSRLGLFSALLFCFFAFYTFRVSEALALGNYGTYFNSVLVGAPIIGYLGGYSPVREEIVSNGLKILGLFFSFILLANWLSGGPAFGYEGVLQFGPLISMAASLFLLSILLLLLKKSALPFRSEKP